VNLSKWSKLGQAAEVQRRLGAHARRMAPGSLGGRTESASPVSPTAKGLATPQTRPPEAVAGAGPEVLTVFWNANEVAAPATGAYFAFEQMATNGAESALSWDQATDRTRVELNEDGIVFVHARILAATAPATNELCTIFRDAFAMGVAFMPAGRSFGGGAGFDLAEPSGGSGGPIRLQNNLTVTPTSASLMVVFYPGFTFHAS
jgi:hypothetical protein